MFGHVVTKVRNDEYQENLQNTPILIGKTFLKYEQTKLSQLALTTPTNKPKLTYEAEGRRLMTLVLLKVS